MHPAGSTISIPTKLLATGVACAVAVVVCGTAASVVVASDATGKLKKYSDARKSIAGGTRASDTFRLIGTNALLIDSIIAPLGMLPPAQPLDIAVLNTLNAKPGARLDDAWETSPIAKSPGPLPEGSGRRVVFKGQIDSSVVTPEWLARAEADTASPWMPVFRRWARSQQLPSLWGYRAGLPGLAQDRSFPIRSFQGLSALFNANAVASVLELRAGRHAAAMERARENIAGARHLVEQPIELDAMLGRIQLSSGAALLKLVATRAGDTATVRQAAQLEAATKKYYFGPGQLVAEEADPASHAAEKIIADPSMLPAHRLASFQAIIRGGCRNTREIVFGFDGRRRETMQRAVAAVSDIPRGTELAQQYARYLDYAMSDAHSEKEPPKGSVLDRNEILKLFSWIVPPGVRARATLCLEQG